jgi:ribosome modulation factor
MATAKPYRDVFMGGFREGVADRFHHQASRLRNKEDNPYVELERRNYGTNPE